MSLPTWTPGELSSEVRRLAGVCWRVVEAQHQVSTLKLADTIEEQALLENLIEKTKFLVPPECRHLDYLLATPFRYDTPYPRGSRFRRPGKTLGVFYASKAPETAVAEMAFYRLLFFAESPDASWPTNAGEYTAFAASYRTRRALDLTRPPLDADHIHWSDTVNYSASQNLADTARAAEIQILRYASVRDPGRRINLALLVCAVFTSAAPTQRQTWRIRLSSSGVQAICEFPRMHLDFGRDSFDSDPRIATLKWNR
jgi:RES domain-containing protein